MSADAPTHTCQSAIPGEPGPDALLARMIRVDHAGEFGARRCAGRAKVPPEAG